MKKMHVPFTWKPIREIIPCLATVVGPQVVYLNKMIMEPATLKFVFYYMLQRDKLRQTKRIGKLTDLSYQEMEQLMEATGIDADSVGLMRDAHDVCLYKLQGHNYEKSVQKLLEKEKNYMEISGDVPMTKKELQTELFPQYPKYSGLHEYNFALKQDTIAFDCYRFGKELLKKLLLRENFSIRYNSEVSSVDIKDGTVRRVNILGKVGSGVDCDAIVLCSGPFAARQLYSIFGVFCPIMPVKGYSFDIPTDCEPQRHKQILVFEDTKFAASFNENANSWRITGYGDCAGLDTNYDQRRIRTLLNVVCKTFETKEALKHENMSSCLRPCSPDDLPILGPLKKYPNVYLNVGHGARGWTQSFGTSKLVSEMLQGHDLTGLIPEDSNADCYRASRFQI